MPCEQCASDSLNEFGAEINIHFSGLRGLDIPAVLVFQKVLVCLRCGLLKFTLPEPELRELVSFTGEEKKASGKPNQRSDP